MDSPGPSWHTARGSGRRPMTGGHEGPEAQMPNRLTQLHVAFVSALALLDAACENAVPTLRAEPLAPADVDPAQSTPTWVVPTQTCGGAGWAPTVGMIHSHPTGTAVPNSDGRSFIATPYPVDAIMCADHVVWISRAMVQQQITLATN